MTAITAYYAVRDGLFNNGLATSFRIIKTLRPQMFLLNLAVQVIVVVVAMYLVQFPVLDWNWWRLIDTGASAYGTNASLAWITIPFIAPIFIVLLAITMPVFALTEEVIFRDGTLNWTSAIWRSIAFGLIHCTVGVSIGIGLALSIAGLWFSYQYFRGGIRRSTAYHTAWNLSILALLAYALVA